jgi:hypothetical protein
MSRRRRWGRRQWSRRAVLGSLAAMAGCLDGGADDSGGAGSGRNDNGGAGGGDGSSGDGSGEDGGGDDDGGEESTTEPVDVREWPDEYYSGPLVSAHEHMTGPDGHAMDQETMDWFVRWMDRNRVAQAMAITSDSVLAPVEAHDDRLVPFAFGFNEQRAGYEGMAASFRERLEEHPVYDGIGELGSGPVNGEPIRADHPELLAVYDLAAEYDVPVMFHPPEPWEFSDERRDEWDEPADWPVFDQLAAAYEHNRDTDFLVHQSFTWHDVPTGELVARDLEDHPNLYYDLSPIATPFFWDDQELSQDNFEDRVANEGVEQYAQQYYDQYATILEEHSDRVLWGMDASYDWHYTPWALDTFVVVTRAMLGKLPAENARNVGYRTAEELFDVDVEDGG